MPRRGFGLHAYLGTAFAAGAVALSLTLGLIATHELEARLEHQTGDYLAELSYQMLDKLDRSMFERFKDIRSMAATETLASPHIPVETKRNVLEAMQRNFPAYVFFGVADLKGTVIASAGRVLEGQSVAKEPWFKAGLKGPYVGEGQDSPMLARLEPLGRSGHYIDLAAPVLGQDGHPHGVFVAHMSLEWGQELKSSLLGQGTDNGALQMLVLDRQGRVMLGPLSAEIQVPAETLMPLRFNRHGLMVGPGGTTYMAGLAVSRGYRGYPGLGWQVLVRLDAARAREPARALGEDMLHWRLLFGGLFALLGWFTAGLFARPLENLCDVLEQFRRGDRQVRATRSFVPELDALADGTNRLLNTLSHEEASLKETNESLQQAVARLKEADRHKSEFLSIVSHELRTPLTNIIGYSWLLSSDGMGALTPAQRDCLGLLTKGAEPCVTT